MTICYFGNYDPEYARNRVMLAGLRQNGAFVVECRTALHGMAALRELVATHRKIKGSYGILIVGYSDSRLMVPLARMLTSAPVVWDAFYSLYDSWVYDRKLVGPWNPKAWAYWGLDWLSCRLSKKILLDTNEHIRYFQDTFFIPARRFVRVLIGADDLIFHP
jgi:hypothetical protein